jgi:hypothetical protein
MDGSYGGKQLLGEPLNSFMDMEKWWPHLEEKEQQARQKLVEIHTILKEDLHNVSLQEEAAKEEQNNSLGMWKSIAFIEIKSNLICDESRKGMNPLNFILMSLN